MTEDSWGSTVNDEARKKLFDYAIQGKWVEAKKLYQEFPFLRLEKITLAGDTLLHLAVWDRKESVVEEMVELLTRDQRDDLRKLKNEQGNTPLHLAASIGNVSMCKCFLKRRKDLLCVRNEEGENPIFLAARHGKIAAFLCLQRAASESDLLRNNKGETILHTAIAGGHFRLAFLIIERYEYLCGSHDEKGVSPLHLLAKQPTAFRSGTRLSLMDKIIYHCIFLIPLCYEDAEESYGSAEKKTLSKILPVPWNNNIIKGLFSFAITFIKVCINPSSLARMDADEENRLTQPDQGPGECNNENGKRVGLNHSNFPVNYETCFNFFILLIDAILVLLLGIGRSYKDKIREKKENHFWSAKILKKILEKGRGIWYDSTGTNPLYKDRTITYKPELSLGAKPDKDPELEKRLKGGTSTENMGHEQVLEVQRSPDLMHKLVLEEVQRSTDSIHKLLEQAQTNGLTLVNDKSLQEMPKSPLKEDTNWALMETMCKAINQTAKKLGDELLPAEKEGKLETPILIAAQNGIKEVVESILAYFPEAIHDANAEKKNVVLLAVENRHPHVYNVLLDKVNNLTDTVFGAVDKDWNSALHLAAMFTDPRPWLTPGAALQMQWEVKWFEYVKNSRPSNVFPTINKKGESPQQIFTDRHKDLVQTGGKWLNNTATSCSVVSTLIATVAFASSATLPGGNNDHTGMPVLGPKPAFHVFAISSLVALCSSTTATVMFLAILTSRHREKDFAKDLPTKLLAGLTSLFVSIFAILVTFCSSHFFVLQKDLKSFALPIYALTCLPATLFAIAQLPLYLDLMWTTFNTVPQTPLEDNY